MKVSAIIRKDQPDKDNLCKIYIRINDGSERKYIPTNIKVLAGQFEKGIVVKHPRAKALNDELQSIVLKHRIDPVINRESFRATADKFLIDAKSHHTLDADTIKSYRSQIGKFLEFAGDNLLLSRINSDLLKNYNAYLIEKGNGNNTRWNAFKALKRILNAAGVQPNPISNWKERPRYKQTIRIFLTAEEVKKIKALEIEHDNPLYKIQQWFLLQCHIGVSVSDLKRIDPAAIISSGRILLNRKKGGVMANVPLNKEIIRLLKKAGPLTITEQKYNEGLKSIAVLAKIKKKLSSHVARHTFAMRAMEVGMSTESIADLLGHQRITTTKIYAKIQNTRVDKEFKAFKY